MNSDSFHAVRECAICYALRAVEKEAPNVEVPISTSTQLIANPGGATPTIEHGVNPSGFLLNPVVHGEREAFGEHPLVAAEINGMDTRTHDQ